MFFELALTVGQQRCNCSFGDDFFFFSFFFMFLLEGFYAPLWCDNILSSTGIISEFLIISLLMRLIFVIPLNFGEQSFSPDSSKVESKGHKEVVFKCLVEVKALNGR